MRKIKRDDEVIVIAGKDKGKRGKVARILENDRLIVSGINMVKKHQKPNPMLQQPGGIIEKEAAIAASNVAIFNAATGGDMLCRTVFSVVNKAADATMSVTWTITLSAT